MPQDYAALARRFGGATAPAAQAPTDYSALARRFGGDFAAPEPRRTHRTEDYLERAEPEGSALGRFARNFGEMVNPIEIAKGAWNMLPVPEALGGAGVLAPARAAMAIGGAQVDQLRQAREAFGEGRYQEAAGHTGAGLLPIVGPMAAAAGEQIGSGDIAGGLGKAAGVLAPFGVKPALKATARALPGRNAIAGALEQGAQNRVAEVISPRANTNVGRRMGNKAQKIAPKLTKDSDLTSNWSRQGLHEQVNAKLVDAEAGLDAVNDARLSALTFETKPILDDLRAKRAKYEAQPVEASKLKPKLVSPDVKDVEAAVKQRASVQQADREFLAQWLASDLRELPFQPGGVTRTMAREAEENYRPGDPTGSRYGIGRGAARIAGTPTQQMFKAIGVSGSRAEIADRLQTYIQGKPNPKFDALADAMAEAWTGEKFDWNRISNDTLKLLGPRVRRVDFKSPQTVPPGDARPDVLARWMPDAPEAQGVSPLIEEVIPKGEKVGKPLGKSVVPAPLSDRVSMIDQAIAEIKSLGPVARYEDIRTIRQAYDQPAKTRYNPAVTPDFLRVAGKADGAADVTGTLREHLAKWDPETAAANADYSLYKSAKDILDASAEIERVRPKVGRQIMARLTGSIFGNAAAGPVGAAAGIILGPTVDQALGSGFTTKLQTAKLMQSIADAIRKGDSGKVASLEFSLRKLMKPAAFSTAQANQRQLQPASTR